MTDTYTYLPKQLDALDKLSHKSDCERVLYGGSAGSGKSEFGCMWQIERRLKYQGSVGLIGREELKALKSSTLLTFFRCAAKRGLVADQHYKVNHVDGWIKFINPVTRKFDNESSMILLKELKQQPRDPDFQSLGSFEITDYFIDEAGEITQKAADIIHTRCRFMLNEIGSRPKGLMTCNPAKGWLYNEVYQKWRTDSLPKQWAFIPALPTDNPYLPDSYIESLENLPEYDRQRLLLGNWEFDQDEAKMFDTPDLLRCFRDERLSGTKYITADIARMGRDRSVIVVWDGMSVIEIKELSRTPVTEAAQMIRTLMAQHGVNLKNVIVDEDGIGGGVVDIMKCIGFLNGGKPKDDKYQSMKAQCYYLLANVIEQGKITFLNCERYRDELIRQFEQIRRHRPQADGKLNVTPKEEIKRRYGASPDHADAIMMRMYFNLHPNLGKYVFA